MVFTAFTLPKCISRDKQSTQLMLYGILYDTMGLFSTECTSYANSTAKSTNRGSRVIFQLFLPRLFWSAKFVKNSTFSLTLRARVCAPEQLEPHHCTHR